MPDLPEVGHLKARQKKTLSTGVEVEGGDPYLWILEIIHLDRKSLSGCLPFLNFLFILRPYALLVLARFAVQIEVEGVDFMTSGNVRS